MVGQPGQICDVWIGKVVSVNDGDTLDVDVAKRPHAPRRAGSGSPASRRWSSRPTTSSSRAGDCHAVDATLRLEQLVRDSRGRVRLAADDPESRSRGRFIRTARGPLRRPLDAMSARS